MMRKLNRILFEEANLNHAKIQLARILDLPFPEFTSLRIRAAILRMIGFDLGRGTFLLGMPRISGDHDLYQNLTVGQHVGIGVNCYIDLAGSITIGDHTAIGPEVMLITGTHEIGPAERRTGALVAKPIVIGQGVWLGARCTVLPGVTIGDGAVIAAAAVVGKDVPPGVLAGGNPARILRKLETK